MYRHMMRLLSVCCLMGFGFLHAAWSPPDDLSADSQDADTPQIAVDANGNATAVWSRFNGTNWIIQASTKLFGGSWQDTPDDLSETGQDAFRPQLAVDANGNATVVWTRFNGTNWIIQASTKPFGGIWQETPDDLSKTGQSADYHQIAVDANGNATAVWMRNNGAELIIQASTKLFGENWQETPDDLSETGQDAWDPQIAVDANGNATAVWSSFNGTNWIIQASTKLFGGTWQETPDDLSETGQNTSKPQIAVDANGNATAVWYRSNGTDSIIQASTKPFDGTWQPAPKDLSAPSQVAADPQIAVDANGNATAVWMRSNGTNFIIQASTKPFGGSWQETPDDLSETGQDAWHPQIAVDANGNATAVWYRSNGTNSISQASIKPFGGNWQETPDDLSETGQNAYAPQIAMDANGNATAVWMRSNGTNVVIQSSTPFLGPTVTHLNPNSGPTAGGTSVTITGTDFFEGSTVMFGSTPAASVIVNSPTSITAIAPPGTGTIDVTVTVQELTSPITAADQYTYQSQPARFKGKVKRSKHKLFIKTTWKKSTTNNIARYEIFARHKRIKKISAHEKPRATIHLHPHSLPHHISKKYRHYIHNKYKIRSTDTSGTLSPFTQLKIRH